MFKSSTLSHKLLTTLDLRCTGINPIQFQQCKLTWGLFTPNNGGVYLTYMWDIWNEEWHRYAKYFGKLRLPFLSCLYLQSTISLERGMWGERWDRDAVPATTLSELHYSVVYHLPFSSDEGRSAGIGAVGVVTSLPTQSFCGSVIVWFACCLQPSLLWTWGCPEMVLAWAKDAEHDGWQDLPFGLDCCCRNEYIST